ncbi:MAG: hypothetical protein IKO93_23215, partial [Lentisphaeria bacterium]|nr:hypothetical protein [Lentisphaeria bacterium]
GTLLFNGGCANHLRNTESTVSETEKKILNTKYELKINPDNIRDTSYHVEVQKKESQRITKFEVHTLKKVVTPYSGWREIYEIPAGIGLLPVSIGAHLVFICTLGILPYDIPRTVTDLAFTGMNPALNWEDEDRSEESLVSLNRKLLSDINQNVELPLARQSVIVRSGNQSRNFITDDFGGFDLHFLALNSNEMFFPTSRKLSFILADGDKELKHYILTRNFLAKLLWARAKINAYRMNPSGQELFNTVIYLEKNGFEQLAYSLEENELTRMRNNQKFQKDFKAAAQK